MKDILDNTENIPDNETGQPDNDIIDLKENTDNLIEINDGGDLQDLQESEEEKVGEKGESVESKPFISEKNKDRLRLIKKKIHATGLTDPKMIKDMFFGSQITEKDKGEYSDGEGFEEVGENDEESEENSENQLVFSKKSKKRSSADPNQDKMFFSFDYMVTPEQAADGYLLFYNEFVKKKNIRITWLFGILAAGFLLSILIAPDEYLNYLLMLICLSVIAMKWLNSYNAKKDAVVSADDVINDSYKLSFYNSRIVIEASELAGDKLYSYPPVMIRFEDIELKVIDYEDLYVLIFKKDYIYSVPKNAMTDKMNDLFKRHLSNILGDDYREYYRKQSKGDSDEINERLSEEERE